MTDKEEFSFKNEEKSSPGADSDISWMEQEASPEIPGGPANGRKGSMTRILLLVLLLVAVGASGFSFLLGAEDTELPPPVQVAAKKQPIAVPPQPVEETPSAEKESMPAADESAPHVPAPETAKPAEEKAQPEKSLAALQADSGRMSAMSSPGEVSEQPAPAKGIYTIAAGAFLLRSNLAGAERKVTESGFEPQVVRKMKWMDMTRLRVGIFSPEEGKKKMEELEPLTSQAFFLPVDGRMAVYAASFQNLDKARSFADRLYKQGLRVEEESAQVEIPLYLLSFGGFDDLESAQKAAQRVRTAGLDAIVVKNP
jgi:hypothetical protein